MCCKRTKHILLACWLITVPASAAFGLITGSHGNDPIRERGLPEGSAAVANLKQRLGYWVGPPFGGGEYHFEYRSENTQQFNAALAVFAQVDAGRLELVVHNGPYYSFWLRDNDEHLEQEGNRIDWSFTVWNAENWKRLYNDPNSYFLADHPNYHKPVAPPRIDLYITRGGSINWDDVKVPANVAVIDRRPGSIGPEYAGKGLVDGKVLDMETGEPIAGAEVSLVRRDGRDQYTEVMGCRTDAEGFCRMSGVATGYYYIRIRADGYAPRQQGGYDNKRPEYHTFETSLAKATLARGVVVDQGGNPMMGLTVEACDIVAADGFGYRVVGETAGVTDALGWFTIAPLPGGQMRLRIAGREFHSKQAVLKRYDVLSDDINLVVTGTGIVRGKVVDAAGNTPAGEIILELDVAGDRTVGTWGYSGKVKSDGRFEIKGIPPGEYVITTRPNPSRTTYQPNRMPINVEGGREYEIEVKYTEPKWKR